MYQWWHSERSLKTYDEMLSAFNTARNPDKGKPVNHNWRLFKVNDTIKIKFEGYGEQWLADVTPDNVITFVAPDNHMYNSCQSYVSSFHRWFPFTVVRHRKGLYRIQHTAVLDKNMNESEQVWKEYNKVMYSSPSYFKGLQFNLLTGECLNQRPDDKFIEIPEKRKEWRRLLTAFKKGMKARAKVHALDGIATEVVADREGKGMYANSRPDWSSDEWQDLLETCIRKTDYPKQLLKGFVQSSMGYGYYSKQQAPTPKEIQQTVDSVMNDLSIPMRRRFGVFEQEGHDENKVEKYMGGTKLEVL
jgi:hypothetical protein